MHSKHRFADRRHDPAHQTHLGHSPTLLLVCSDPAPSSLTCLLTSHLKAQPTQHLRCLPTHSQKPPTSAPRSSFASSLSNSYYSFTFFLYIIIIYMPASAISSPLSTILTTPINVVYKPLLQPASPISDPDPLTRDTTRSSLTAHDHHYHPMSRLSPHYFLIISLHSLSSTSASHPPPTTAHPLTIIAVSSYPDSASSLFVALHDSSCTLPTRSRKLNNSRPETNTFPHTLSRSQALTAPALRSTTPPSN